MELRPDILARRDLINNPRAQRVRRLAGLSRRSFRIKTGLTIIEGPHALGEALTYAPGYIQDLYIAEESIDRHQELLQLALEKGSYVHPVTAAVMGEFTEAAQGIAASFKLAYFSKSPLDALSDTSLGVALPRTQDPGNLGSIIRTADACGARYMVVCKGTADPFSPKVIRNSAGSIFHLPVISLNGLKDFQQLASKCGINLVGTVVQGGTPLPEFVEKLTKQEKICWIFGNEAQGLAEGELKLCQELVSIPIKGQAESFNVACAAVIALYESSQKLC